VKRFLGLSAADQKLAFEQAAAQRGLAASSVEKDFWVCWTLGVLFEMPELAPHLTFEGGTSLSKAWGLIDRFSEDIDLTIDRAALGFDGEDSPEHAPSTKQLRKRLKDLKAACASRVAGDINAALAARIGEVVRDGEWALALDPDDADRQTHLLTYPTRFPAQADRYIPAVVKMEFGARSDPWPAEMREVRAFVAEAFPSVFENPICMVRALMPRRTFWEKAMLLHEETFRPDDKPRRPRMARHYYDLYHLIEQGIGAEAMADMNLFEQVLAHRQVFFEQSWVDYSSLKPGTLRLMPMASQEAGWREDYVAMQSEMFREPPPSFDVVLNSVSQFERTFNSRPGA
jgi:predicted nucleotidyltransferase component of viral defense system